MTAELPPFYCPIRRAVHPEAARIEQRAIAWTDEIGLYRDEVERAWGIATRSAELACRVLPTGPEDTVWLFSAWNYWSFALSDWQDGERERASAAGVTDFTVRVIRALEEPAYRPPAGNRLTAALAELIARTRAGTTAAQFRRLTEGLRDWLLAQSWHVANSERRIMPELDDFAAIRPLAKGARLFAAWLEIGNGLEIPGGRRWAPDVHALTSAAGFVVSCDNDLVGYAAGQAREIPEQNLVNVLIHQRHCSFQHAVAEAVAIRDRVLTRFLSLRNRITTIGTPELRRYAESLNRYVRGTLDWMSSAPRYASPRTHNDLPLPSTNLDLKITGRPAGESTEPPDIPSIEWWWKL
ncbi:MAG TPA: hypothetical protein VJT49_15785 [Amycolatopsis sp.]|uniref:terpene synthase family protein n=1 Tax=Amycolatopsis sp. TaxID=37632 RepID=UPI002B49025B|nr:hypothetical protein [Amycolatopsis sp.]HKS46539.1 hypothetical protein [Amycolatopsis sp.]